MNVVQLITKKRDGHQLTEDEIGFLVGGYAKGDVPDYQMSAFAMAVFFQGMVREETVALTRQMLNSGVQLDWDGVDDPVVDKHSTGGVGDKISIPLAPILACLDLKVPMISGRGLGATGGTLDKLEAIPGFRTDLNLDEIKRVTKDVGCVITGATKDLAPADRALYALRDVTGTVPSIPLITASILSKKLSAGLDALVLDVKWGSGAFMKTMDQANALAESLVNVGSELGVKVSALITDMNQPLGRMIGNAVEIMESIDVLQGNGPKDVTDLTFELALELNSLVRDDQTREIVARKIRSSIDSGAAYEMFEKMVSAQGGDLASLEAPQQKSEVYAQHDGCVRSIDTEALGWALIEMGGGRKKVGDAINHQVGVEFLVEIGDHVEKSQTIAHVFDVKKQNEMVHRSILDSIELSMEAVDARQLIVERVTSH